HSHLSANRRAAGIGSDTVTIKIRIEDGDKWAEIDLVKRQFTGNIRSSDAAEMLRRHILDLLTHRVQRDQESNHPPVPGVTQ
ncbi:MAG: hypothetical protein KGJ13_11330, partial [Patescibacteria group bacterium]|nr:hypothetical protein [Patescibacteria group bacterium]